MRKSLWILPLDLIAGLFYYTNNKSRSNDPTRSLASESRPTFSLIDGKVWINDSSKAGFEPLASFKHKDYTDELFNPSLLPRDMGLFTNPAFEQKLRNK